MKHKEERSENMEEKSDRPFYEDYGYTLDEWISRERDFEHMNNMDYALNSTFECEELGAWAKILTKRSKK